MKVIKSTVLGVLAGCLLAVPVAKATTVNLTVGLTDPYALGTVSPGVDFGDGDIPGYINTMIGLSLNGTVTLNYANHTNTWVRSNLSFSPLGQVDASASGVSNKGQVTSFVPTGQEYLLAKYDGPNGGLMLWYVGGLTGDTLNIPQNAFGPDNASFGLSGSWLVVGTQTPSVAPDGGSTALLLGSALSVLGLCYRRFARA